jgi:hypothetical protein
MRDVPSDEKNSKFYSQLHEISNEIKSNTKMQKQFLNFLFKLKEYNNSEFHIDNKLRYIYYLTDSDILYDRREHAFIYSINLMNDGSISKQITMQSDYYFVHPKLNKLLNESAVASPVKNNEFLCWSIAILLLIFVYDVNVEGIQSLYTKCLANGRIVDFNLDRVVNSDLDRGLVNNLLYYNEQEGDSILNEYFYKLTKSSGLF